MQLFIIFFHAVKLCSSVDFKTDKIIVKLQYQISVTETLWQLSTAGKILTTRNYLPQYTLKKTLFKEAASSCLEAIFYFMFLFNNTMHERQLKPNNQIFAWLMYAFRVHSSDGVKQLFLFKSARVIGAIITFTLFFSIFWILWQNLWLLPVYV